MKLSVANFLTQIKNLVTGGGRDGSDAKHDAGFLKRLEGIGLQSIAPTSDLTATAAALTVADGAGTNNNTIETITADASVIAAVQELADEINKLVLDTAAIRAKLGMTADETNARVIKVEEAIDTIGNIVIPIPRDYDEATDELKLRVLASMVTVSTDNDVQLDSELYKKRPGSALSADLAPAAPSTILSTTEQWIEFNYTGNSFRRDDVAIIELITNGANDTDGEEVLIHSVELVYRSTLVSYDFETTAGVALR